MANTTIQHKRSLTSGNLPEAASLKQGELAINIPDRRVFTKDQTNTVIDVFGQSVNTTANVSFRSGVFSNGVTTTQYTSNIAVGTAPLVVTSTTVVTNLNTDLLDGQHGSFYTNATNISTGTLGAARLPAFTGDATSSAGSSNLTLASTGVVAGTYGNSSIIPSITVDAKGRVTSVVNTAAVAGVSNFSYASSNNTFSIVTSAGSAYEATINQVNNLTITGNLVVSGATTYINTNQLNIGDNIIALNADLGAVAPTENAGLSVNRGSSANVDFIWNETSDEWTLGNTAVTGYISSTSTVTGTQLVSSVATGTAPFVVASNTVVTNLNADLLDGFTSSYFANATHNHTTLTGVTSISFASEASDYSSIATTVSGANTYFDFILADDPYQSDTWRWRFVPAVGTIFSAMELDCSAQGVANLTVPGLISSSSLSSSVATGTAPLTVTSTTLVTNLNADLLDSQQGSYYTNASNMSTGTLPAARLPAFTGDATSTVGTSALTLSTTGVTAGTYGNSSIIPSITVDAKGRVTSIVNTAVAGASSVSNFSYASGNNTFSIATGDGSSYNATISQVNDLTITGNLVVSGTTTYINTTALNIGDAVVVLNADLGAVAPTENAGLTINRGSSANVEFLWNETSDVWTLGNTSVTGTIAASGTITGSQYTSTIATGTAPLVVTSTTAVTNLNADLLDGQHGSYYSNATNLSTGTIPAARLPAFTGDATSTVGTSALTLSNTGVTAGTYGNSSIIPSITVDAKGRITSVVNNAVAGVSNLSYASGNNTLTITTSAGSSYSATISSVAGLTSTSNVVVSATTNTNSLYVTGGALYIGNSLSNSANYIAFGGITGDTPGSYITSFIGERLYGGSESSEILIFKGNDVEGSAGPDRVRVFAANFQVDTYTTATSGSFATVGASASATPRFIIKQNGYVGINTTSPGYNLQVNGSFAATTKSFLINHPTKPNMQLRYGSLEGPENGVYVRGRSTSKIILLPEYWVKLVDPDSITVELTPIGRQQKLYVKDISNNQVVVGGSHTPSYFYTVYGERCDVEKLEEEIG